MYHLGRCPRSLVGQRLTTTLTSTRLSRCRQPKPSWRRESHNNSGSGTGHLNPTVESDASSPHFQSHYPPPETQASRPKRIVIGITGATGAPYAIHMLKVLREMKVETHLIMSKWALATLKYETTITEHEMHALATRVYTAKDMSAPIASGSFIHDGMAIVPCSMKTLAAIRSGFCDDLISRAADVCLKENRKVMLAVRETPLSDIHLDNMLFLRRAGAIIFPPVPAFYTWPKSLDDMVAQSVGRMLDCFGIHTDGFARWNGFEREAKGAKDGGSKHASQS